MNTESTNTEHEEVLISTPGMAPAEGERRAIRGYYPQYRLAAILLVRALRHDDLEWIRVADPDAGRVDDFQIGTPSRVDAYQIKWSAHSGFITFHSLTSGSRGTPSLIRQLADGWTRLRQRHLGDRVVVHLATNDRPSDRAEPPHGEPAPTPRHFAAFVEQAWTPSRQAVDDWQVPPEWQIAWEALREASGLSEPEFPEFVRDCELEFGLDIEPHVSDSEADRQLHERRIREVTEFLMEAVADPSRLIELRRDELLRRLGWSGRLEMRSSHDFPVDSTRYEPIEGTATELEEALDQLVSGYLAIVGDPGSGKSTLLTETLRRRSERERVIRYYAYVPGDPALHRGDAVSFLHNLTRQIDRAGFDPGQSIGQFDLRQLTDRLTVQLQLLHEDWQQNGRKTLILVDGLDHVRRQPRTGQPLLNVIPPDVPDGVLFILGTQTTELDELHSQIKHQVSSADRRIEMQRLTRQQVHSLANRALEQRALTGKQLDKIYELSAGHPLVLNYVINRIQHVGDSVEVDAALDELPPYSGDIEQYYFGLWNHIHQDDHLVRLLGLLARMRDHIDLAWVRTWCPSEVVMRLRRVASHLFVEETQTQWYFFHDSFRQFLLEKTADACGGDEALHTELAQRCAGESEHPYWSWQELYHRWEARDHESVLGLATQQRFREQFLALRPAEAIEEDIKLALRSAAAKRDPVSFARVILAGSELSQRRYNIESADLVELLIDVQDPEKASRQLRLGNRMPAAS